MEIVQLFLFWCRNSVAKIFNRRSELGMRMRSNSVWMSPLSDFGTHLGLAFYSKQLFLPFSSVALASTVLVPVPRSVTASSTLLFFTSCEQDSFPLTLRGNTEHCPPPHTNDWPSRGGQQWLWKVNICWLEMEGQQLLSWGQVNICDGWLNSYWSRDGSSVAGGSCG